MAEMRKFWNGKKELNLNLKSGGKSNFNQKGNNQSV